MAGWTGGNGGGGGGTGAGATTTNNNNNSNNYQNNNRSRDRSEERLSGAKQDLFELLERVQCSRIDDQRCVLPSKLSLSQVSEILIQLGRNLAVFFPALWNPNENKQFSGKINTLIRVKG